MALVVKNLPANAGNIRDAGSILSWKDHLEKEMTTNSIFLPGKSHGQREGYSPYGRKELDTPEAI